MLTICLANRINQLIQMINLINAVQTLIAFKCKVNLGGLIAARIMMMMQLHPQSALSLPGKLGNLAHLTSIFTLP